MLRRRGAAMGQNRHHIKPGLRGRYPRIPMPISRYLQTAAFDGDATKAMGEAFELALKSASLNDRSDPLAELLAHKIIQVYRLGEHEPAKLSERALKELGVLVPDSATAPTEPDQAS
jgi:hypothetical protein